MSTTSDALVPVITNAGLAETAALGNGLSVAITQIGIGQGVLTSGSYGGYNPQQAQVALQNEVMRVPILSGAPLGQNAFEVLAIVPGAAGPANFFVWEVGFYTSKGNLFAVWSSPQFPLAAKVGLADIELAFDLFLQQLPPGSITVNVSGPGIPSTIGVLAELLAVHGNAFAGRVAGIHRRFIAQS